LPYSVEEGLFGRMGDPVSWLINAHFAPEYYEIFRCLAVRNPGAKTDGAL
jgi:hypothetical protein